MIRLNDLKISYRIGSRTIDAVDGVTLTIPDNCVVGIAGESGSGKSTLMKAIYGDIQSPMYISRGSIDYGLKGVDGKPVTAGNVRKEWFKSISYVPQSSMNSLNPVIKIREQFIDFPGTDSNKKRVLEKARAYIGKLGLPPEAMDSYPHQLSGGMRQRMMIALATFFQPELIIADEPTTALDVVVQKDILMLLMELQEEMGNTILVVSHDMGVHYQVTHKMLIMYAGRVVEYGDTDSVFADPQHPYTRMLIDSLPTIGDDSMRGVLASQAGASGDRAYRVEPNLIEVKPGHFVAQSEGASV
ncbi:ABC transporter ATP-binding protein [Devosia sp. XJ19-1]|uniref:ABC transporter ATP-binding protein n=1 Tax=Devosia ureilytica TaxID=2952754 RepID=A0A9Q4FSY4_9HYPH|nr:ABC transporter ATP-binding protein [Devosia ureilytica]MCP8883757.1 ABC transporter ATP-binding protein [Devosia ureilytica]MCP8887365.1 ABC transporter ATP-binding protein [Devosia ureilytica]